MSVRACVLSSGGIDSYITWWLEGGHTADNLFIDLSHKYSERELNVLYTLQDAKVQAWDGTPFTFKYVKGAAIGNWETPSGIIPNRNAELILTASTTGYSDIMMGVLKDEINSDKSPEFMSAMQTMLDISWRQQYWNSEARIHRVWSPIRHFTKTELIKHYLDHGGDSMALLRTVSCYSAGDSHCGACPSCFKRWVALTNNGIEQQHWLAHPLDWSEFPTILKKAQDGTYNKSRADEIMQAVSSPARKT